MTTETLPTAPLPPPVPGPDWLPDPGTYGAAPDRCIVELTARFGPLTTLRRRLTALDATLTVAPDSDDCVLSLELAGRPLGGRLLTFVSTSLTPTDEATRLHVPGELALAGDPVEALFGFRVVERTTDRLLVLGTAQLPYRHLHRRTGLALPRTRPTARVRLLVAAEFTCAV
ncbi:hypothetical protein GCM10022403_091290 [Streptomyces coacervatus]|uniref:Uncharacterized protein n=1 Tax=Streptomyces coacervatus TaxID=647381 RepID=A0ABP7JHF4_9ACTN|nr:hypothetical protein [Streptomyces coacervatus]MDF2272559.1 hypothetical protein [Streptomyces coacervatus]